MINGFTHFQGCIRDVFYDYVDLVGRNFREKCRDEMAGTRVIVHHFDRCDDVITKTGIDTYLLYHILSLAASLSSTRSSI